MAAGHLCGVMLSEAKDLSVQGELLHSAQRD
jgi:hypothetical protein